MHCIGVFLSDGRIYMGADQPGYDGRMASVTLPSGRVLSGVKRCSIREALKALEEADIRVAHNGQDFDERITRKFYRWWKPRGKPLDTLIISRLLYPIIARDGPNTHKCPPRLRNNHSVEAWGYRLGEKKNKDFDPGDWQTWSEDMCLYMMQDCLSLDRIWKWVMSRKPDPRALDVEHGFAAIIRRQEAWGFTFDHAAALTLQADLGERTQRLELELVEEFGEWWDAGRVEVTKASRKVKLKDFPDVTLPRFNAKGQRLAKDYVGPPMCHWEQGLKYTPVTRVQFSPSSREHVRKVLDQRHGWKPTKFTEKGTPQVDDEVLRALPWEECQKLADYFAALKIQGYVSTGRSSWLGSAYEEGPEYRMHGRVNTIGTYSFRTSMSDPNMGQIPTRSAEWGHRCRRLFIARKLFKLAGYDGSALQLRLLAHYLYKWDRGTYAQVFERDEDPHIFMQNLVGTDLMGEGAPGRGKGKTLNYAIVFGAGDERAGSTISPYATKTEKQRLGAEIKERAASLFGPLDSLKRALKERVEDTHTLVGLDGRLAHVAKPHTALATLLQMAEAVVMHTSLIILDRDLQALGMVPGVDDTGTPHPELADYEFCANVYDEAQADVLPKWTTDYQRLALECIPKAGRLYGLHCPLKADVKIGDSWVDTH